MNLDTREHYLYRAFNDRDDLLYVGRTCNLDGRFSAHRSTSAWWPLMVRRTLDGPMTFDEVKSAERAAIDGEGPQYNADTPGRGAVNGAHRSIMDAACRIAARDGWQFNDAWDIGRATADRLVDSIPVGKPYLRDMRFPALEARRAFMSDQIGYTFLGYRELLENGWVPEWTTEPRRCILPDGWDSRIMGQLPNPRRLYPRPQPPR